MKYLTLSCVLLTVNVLPAVAQQRGILQRTAPTWTVDKWLNLPPGKATLDIDHYRGKVVYLYCFQSWCPGCHSHGLPTLQKMIQRYRGIDDVAFVAVQTVFEGYSSNTFAHAKEVVEQYDLKIPVGQSGENGARSPLMSRYRTGGTPWTIIIDRAGVVRFNAFRATVEQAGGLVDRLIVEPDPDARPAAATKLPPSKTGQALLGKALEFEGLGWLRGSREDVQGKVTLVRWWSENCPHCQKSLPALSRLAKRFGRDGLQTLAVYHPKPKRGVTAADIKQAASRLHYEGPLATDLQWEVLQRVYLDRHADAATSVSFLLDRQGKVRYVHPGPAYFPSQDPAYRQANEDYQTVSAAVQAIIAE